MERGPEYPIAGTGRIKSLAISKQATNSNAASAEYDRWRGVGRLGRVLKSRRRQVSMEELKF